MIDDLRPEMGSYGLPDRHTPNMDKLASKGVVFDRAYSQQAVCGPSRNSFLTGRRPDRSRTWNFINHFREDHPEWTTLPGVFLKNGVASLGSGKTFHPKMPPAYDGDKSWSAEALPLKNPCWNTADDPKIIPSEYQDGGLPCVFCPVDIEAHLPWPFTGPPTSIGNEFCAIDALEDTLTVDDAIKLLRAAANKPFYLAVGMHKPHIPWQASEEDFAAHPLETIDLPTHPLPPDGMPDIAFHWTDGNNTIPGHDSPWHPVSDALTRGARRAYRAAVTGMDRKLGKVLDELDSLGLTNTTAVILHADHAVALGEHGQWRKMTNFEIATRVPLIIKVPWLNTSGRSDALVELVDLLPTIVELGGLTLPVGETPFDGLSLVPVLTKGGPTKVKDAAFSQYPRHVTHPEEEWNGNSIIHHNRSTFTHMGYSVRTEDWRYTEWLVWNQTALLPFWDQVHARELYDHRNESSYPTDFNVGENENVANRPENAAVITMLSQMIKKQFA